jgi:hypothetical protein
MQQFLYWRMQVLILYGGHQKVIDVVGDWYEAWLAASNEQHVRWELVLNHSRAMLLASRPTVRI